MAQQGLGAYMDKKVTVITSDGRTLVGKLIGCDQTTNLVLAQTSEIMFQPPGSEFPSEVAEHGLYLIRGDNVVLCGLVDEKIDDTIDWTKVRGAPFGTVKHAT